MERHAHEVLDAAYEGGVRYFDAARSYGRGEAFLASWLQRRGLSRDDVTVGSKWGYTYTADWRVDADEHEVKDLVRRDAAPPARPRRARCSASTWRFIRSTRPRSRAACSTTRRCATSSRACATAGVRIGLTVTGAAPGRHDRARAGGRGLRRGAGDVEPARALGRPPRWPRAHDAGLGVLVKEALANGRLTARGDAEASSLAAAARERGTTPDALALAAVLAQPWVDVVLSGAATVDTLRSNLAALDVAWDAELDGRLADLAEPAEAYWERRAELAWN